MMLDELKAAWQQYDVRLKSTQDLSNRIIFSMIRERSVSRLSKIKRNYLLGFLQMAVWLVVGFAILAGNPFDYRRVIEYSPIALFCICLLVLILGMAKTYNQMLSVDINHDNLRSSLKRMIEICEKQNKFLDWTVKLLLFSTTILFPLSFLPRKIANAGWAGALLDTLIAIAISATILFVAYKLGAFKERHAEKFKKDLNDLKDLSRDL